MLTGLTHTILDGLACADVTPHRVYLQNKRHCVRNKTVHDKRQLVGKVMTPFKTRISEIPQNEE